MQAAPEPFLKAMASDREDVGGASKASSPGTGWPTSAPQRACPLSWARRSTCRRSLAARPETDRMEAHHSAGLGRGGMLPQASVSPAARRATRDLRRRRLPLTRKRAEWLAPRRQRTARSTCPSSARSGPTRRTGTVWLHTFLSRPCSRASTWTSHGSTRLSAGGRTARGISCGRQRRLRRRPAPARARSQGSASASRACGWMRCPRFSAFHASGGRLRRPAGPGRPSIRRHTRWDLWPEDRPCRPHVGLLRSPGLGLRNHPAGQPSRARLVNKPGQGNAVTLLAHPLARAVSDLWQRDRRARWPKAATSHGAARVRLRLTGRRAASAGRAAATVAPECVSALSWSAPVRRSQAAPAPLLRTRVEPATRLPPTLALMGTVTPVQPPLGRGRYEGTETFLGRRESPHGPAAIAASMATAPRSGFGAGTRRLHLRVAMKSAHVSAAGIASIKQWRRFRLQESFAS